MLFYRYTPSGAAIVNNKNTPVAKEEPTKGTTLPNLLSNQTDERRAGISTIPDKQKLMYGLPASSEVVVKIRP